ncbi:MAG: PAS domain-containing protein [Arcobacter sp.]|uniref:PAS domain-containing protein n=1 Tax=Arcobacter sp. TaxID=1872629 RepID=UPI003C738AC0
MNKTKAILLTIFFIILGNIITFYFIDKSASSQINISKKMVLNESRAHFKDTIHIKEWNTQFNAVYVQSDTIRPNKYLVNNHIFTQNNKLLIKINHAWMTKQISEISNKQGDYYYKLTSLKPINPDNAPDKLEKVALKKFEKEKINEYYTFSKNLKRFTYVGALKVDTNCMACHYQQNYKIGDYIGGVRITIPTNDYKNFYESLQNEVGITKIVIVLLSIPVLLILIWFINNIYTRQDLIQEMAKKQDDLYQRYKLAVDGSNSGLWDWDLVKNKVYFSKEWKAMLGYKPNELLNDIKTWEELINPEDKENAVCDIQNNHNKVTKYYENTHRLRHKDGHWVWILDRGKTFFNKEDKPVRMLGFHTDITQQKELEMSLSNSQQTLLKAEKIANLAHWNLNISTMEITVSENTRRLFGLKENAKFGMKELFNTFVYEEDREEVSSKLTNSVREKSSYTIEYRFKKYNENDIRYMHCNVEHEIVSGKIVNTIGTIQDITKEVYLKQELQDKEELMIAQSRHAAMGEMISMIAHQWRQPIAVVAMGANNILADIELDSVNNDSLKENLDEIISQTEYLSQTIDDFKNFFKPNKEKDLVTVKSVFDETFKVMGKMLENNNITVLQEYKSQNEIYTYSKELLQVFINIIKNAKEALIEKRQKDRIIKINEFIDNDQIILQISDNAGGIDEDILNKIFDPYFTTKDELGTGLGLYMSKIIIEKHLNGQLTVSNKDGGACFEIKFSAKDI